MKRVIILCALILAGCSSDWDNGSQSRNSFEQQREEEQTGTIRNQMPETRPATENAQPF